MEEIFQLLWTSRMLGLPLTLETGERLRVLDPGILNHGSGPDFFNAKVKVGDYVWAGSVEIHLKASDWHRHRHDGDPAYDNVILHVVAVSDTRVARSNGELIPQLAVSLPENFYRTFAYLTSTMPEIRCATRLRTLDSLHRTDWMESLSMERLQQKAARIERTLRAHTGDWNTTCFVTLARGLGFGLNGEPFEMLAESFDLNYLRRHTDNLLQMEALFFGQAGLLDSSLYPNDLRYQLMCREYRFLAQKYSLRPIPRAAWKFGRTRPQNLPYRRIALLAAATAATPDLLQRILATDGDDDRLRPLFQWKTDPYWSRRMTFGSDCQTEAQPPTLSEGSVNILLINVAAPLLYTYGLLHGDHDMKENACRLLRMLPAEKNALVRTWQSLGLTAHDAAESQGLIHLRKEYCDRHECLKCRFAHTILRTASAN